MENAKRANIVVGTVSALLLLGALVGLVVAIVVGSLSFFTVANVLVTAVLAIGFMRGRESAWMVLIAYFGTIAAFQLVLAVSARDPAMGLVGIVSAAIVALVIWAGRQLPEQAPSAA